MDASIQQIVTAYEVSQMTPEEIKAELFAEEPIDILAIKTVLLQFSPTYKARNTQSTNGGGPEPDITDEEFQLLKRTYKQIALHSDDPHLQERACRFLWNEKKGRNDVEVMKLKHLSDAPRMNLTQLAEQLRLAKQLVALSRDEVKKVVDVESQNLGPQPVPAAT